MYHRYLPTGNGQYRRQTVPDRKPDPKPAPAPMPKPDRPPEPVAVDPITEAPPIAPPPSPHSEQTEYGGPAPIHNKQEHSKPRPERRPMPLPFLERLFPNLDGGDLLLVLVLILLLSEGNEESSPTVLTLVLSLLMQ